MSEKVAYGLNRLLTRIKNLLFSHDYAVLVLSEFTVSACFVYLHALRKQCAQIAQYHLVGGTMRLTRVAAR